MSTIGDTVVYWLISGIGMEIRDGMDFKEAVKKVLRLYSERLVGN
jgi:hypothetical protein